MTRVDGSAVTSYLISLQPSGAVVIRPASRSVAQPGRAPRSGRGGRRFKSCHSDQPTSRGVDNAQLSAQSSDLDAPKVHKRVHNDVLRMPTPKRAPDGSYRLRKRLPDDVREQYARLYGPKYEAKLTLPAGTKPQEAKQRFGEWLAEVEGRIATIRAQRDRK